MTGKKYLQTYNKFEILKVIRDQVANVDKPYDLVRLDNIEIADESNKQILAEMILELNEFSNVSRKMSGTQVIETVRMLLSEFPCLSLQEYQVFFKRIKNGHYGQLYESIDGIKIMAFMREFYVEIMEAYNEKVYEVDYQRKIESGSRDIGIWNKK